MQRRKKDKPQRATKEPGTSSTAHTASVDAVGKPNASRGDLLWRRGRATFVAVLGVAAPVAGILALTGYTLRDAIDSPQPLALSVGETKINEGEDIDVVFALQITDDDYPRMLGLPIKITNPSNKKTAQNVVILIKCHTPLKVWPQDLSKTGALGTIGDTKRVTAEATGISTSSWTIPRIAPGSAFIFVDALLWEKNVWKIDTPMTIDVSISGDDRPTRRQTIKLWSAMAFGPIPDTALAISKDAQRAAHGVLVYFENYELMKATKGFETPFYSWRSMDDIKYQPMKTNR
jgi:hypothetical protein